MKNIKRWSSAKVWEWYNSILWIKGFNYVPSNAVNSTEMWQEETFSPELIDRELKLARETGFNACRVFLQYIVWKDDPIAYLNRFDKFLEIASLNGLSVMPILFDDCAFANKPPYLGVQDAPIPGVANSGWTASPGSELALNPSEMPSLKQYLQDFICRYAADDRILIWDMYNEPGNCGMNDKSMPLLERAFCWAREINPTQPLTCAVWLLPYDSKCDAICLAQSDVISFHDYNDYETTEKAILQLSEYDRPILCTEWLNRPGGNRVETHLPLFKAKKIGIYNWGLINGKTQTHLSGQTMLGEPDPYPSKWQHDFYHNNYEPYCVSEISFLKEMFKEN